MIKQLRFIKTEALYAANRPRRWYRLVRLPASTSSERKRSAHAEISMGLSVSELAHLKQLEQEKTKLKQVAAELPLDKTVVQKVSRKKG